MSAPNRCRRSSRSTLRGARSFARAEATDWDRILSLYDDLLTLNPSPIIRLNRAVAVSRVAGPAAALAALRPLHNEPALANYYLLPSVTGRIHAELGERAQATACYRQHWSSRAANPSAGSCIDGSRCSARSSSGGLCPPDPLTRSLAGTPTPRSARVAHSLPLVRAVHQTACSAALVSTELRARRSDIGL